MMTLLERLKEADQKAFKTIYGQFHAKVYAFSFSYVKDAEYAQEITQQVFVRLWEKRQRLSTAKPLEAQIFTITRNLIIDNLRKQGRDKDLKANYLLTLPTKDNKTESDLLFSEYQQQVNQLIDGMPSRRKTIFRMNKLDGRSMDEIAKLLSISPKTVDAHIQLAVKDLRKKLASILHVLL